MKDCTLAEGKCVPCEGGVLPLNEDQISESKKTLDQEAPGWKLNADGYLEKRYEFPDYKASEAFVLDVGIIAEEEGHHPRVSFSWGYVEIIIWTHAINGLSENDFILAAKIDMMHRNR